MLPCYMWLFTIAFKFPPTPAHVLRDRLQEAMTEEAAWIGVTVKIIEGGGQPLQKDLVSLDLTKCPMQNCWPCQSAAETGERGATPGAPPSTGGTASRAWRTARGSPILGKVGSQEVTGSLAPLATAQTSSGATPRTRWPNTRLPSKGDRARDPATPASSKSRSWATSPPRCTDRSRRALR